MKFKRIISAFMAILMLVTSVAMFASCEESEPDGEKESTSGEQGSLDSGNKAEHKVPKKDFGGETFNSLCYDMNTAGHYYFTDEEAAGDPVKEALWQRTGLIVEHLNCTITHEMRSGAECPAVSSMIYDQIMAGTDDYQQVLLHPIYGVSSLVISGYAYDFASLPNVDLTAEWWDLDDMEDLRLGSDYCYGRSDFMISAPHVVIFNKTLVDDLNLDNPYELVNNYQWTLDAMMSMARAATHDANNDGTYSAIDDTFGIASSEFSKFSSFLISCDQPISRRNEEGKIELALYTEKTLDIIEDFYDLWMEGGTVYIGYLDGSSGYTDRSLFGEGRALFALYDLSFLEGMREYDVEAGIVPYPMYDEAQGEYRSMDWGPMWAISATIRNPELVGSVVELYSYYSNDTIVPVYYDKVLEGKLTADLESRKMLDIIFESVSFDPIANYFGFHDGIGDLAFVIGRLVMQKNSSNFASFYKERENSAENTIKEYYKNLEKGEKERAEERAKNN